MGGEDGDIWKELDKGGGVEYGDMERRGWRIERRRVNHE
jgi:hypothetical protein